MSKKCNKLDGKHEGESNNIKKNQQEWYCYKEKIEERVSSENFYICYKLGKSNEMIKSLKKTS